VGGAHSIPPIFFGLVKRFGEQASIC